MIDIHVTQPNYQEYDPYRELAMAIIRQAASDYRRLGRKFLETEDVEQKNCIAVELNSLTEFFLSEWYKILNKDQNGPFVLKQLNEEVFGIG